MSKRSDRRHGAAATPGAAERAGGPPSAARRAGSSGAGWGLGVQIVFVAAVFGVAVLVAELAGAANLGVALGVGQVAFAIAVVYVLMRR